MFSENGARNTIVRLNRLKPVAAEQGVTKYGVTICLELLKSTINHPDCRADHAEDGALVIHSVHSPRVRRPFDICRTQLMEGNVMDSIRRNTGMIGGFHTSGVPGRHEIDAT